MRTGAGESSSQAVPAPRRQSSSLRAGVGAGALVLAALVSLAVVVRQALRAGYSLDRTDEGQYLLLMAHPGDDPATVFLSGYVLHPLYALLGGDVGALRLAGFAVTAALSAGLLHAVARAGGGRRWEAGLAAVAGAGAAVVAFAWFPLTPSYNTIALWGCLLVGIALVRLVEPQHAPRSRGAGEAAMRPTRARFGRERGWVLVGVGVALTGVGKPTSGLAVVLVALLALLALTPWHRVSAALVALAVGGAGTAGVVLLGVFAATRATPGDLLETMLGGLRSVRLLGGHEELVRIDALAPATWPAAWGQAVAGSPWTPTTLQVALLLPLVTLMALGALALRRPGRLGRRVAVVTVALLALPACYAFGTNTNLWSGMGRAAGLWLAALTLAAGARRIVDTPRADTSDGPDHRSAATVTARAAGPWVARAGVPLVVAVALLGAVSTAAAPAFYRYPSPGPDTVTGVVDGSGHHLRLTPKDARDSSAIVTTGVASGRDILDTTGTSPGYIWQLGGRALGSSWLLGGYPGSAPAARHALSLVPCERIRGALVLYAPQSPRRIDALWSDLGVDPTRDYRRILTFTHQLGFEVQLLEPTGARAPRCPTA